MGPQARRAWIDVFSSAQTIRWPFRASRWARSYRVRIGMARSRKRGSVGRCQLWYCHGLMRSALSQRWMVAPEMRRTMRRWTTARASSEVDQRESGLPESRGSVQANAVTCARTAEGEKAWSTGPRRVLQRRPRPAAPPPLAHRPIRAAHGPGNGRVAPVRVLIGQEQNLRPHHFRIGGGATTGEALELPVLRRRQRHLVLRLRSTALRDAPSPGAHRPHDSARASGTPRKPGTNS